ncbi:PAS domain S-box protein [Natronococcus occultus]|uniref:histidine kinase n=1 Tax=Natronococcus occultus SP4 TaxID=694430 RepID=L0K2U8_9EURY|nr:PAS domain-containing sensor histidine kinase [Natronococcus occultus]AGB38865.1 PAS/PAC sensor signal transduction histidine kinase [Natronococcus occultus SP4]
MSHPQSSADKSLPDPHVDATDEFYRLLVANTSEGLLTLDETSTIVFANPAIEEILGYAPETLVGRSKLDIVPDRLEEAHERGFQTYLETGERTIDWDGIELPALHKDGHEIPVTISVCEHEYDGQRLFTGLFRDVSDLKARERRLEEQNEQLERFARTLTHDLRNPLNVVQGYASLPVDEVGQDELDEIAFAAARMETLIENVLALTREGETIGATEPVELEEIATDSWQWVNTDDAELVVESSGTVLADRSRLGSLFENCYRNAVDHGGSAVTVTVGELGGKPGFYVEDDGDGLPDDDRDPFERGVTTAEDGTGLGLAIVERIATAHDWTVDVGAGTDGGARFEFVTSL